MICNLIVTLEKLQCLVILYIFFIVVPFAVRMDYKFRENNSNYNTEQEIYQSDDGSWCSKLVSDKGTQRYVCVVYLARIG